MSKRKHQEKCFHTYGYRRMWLYLKNAGITRNPKTILRIMKKWVAGRDSS